MILELLILDMWHNECHVTYLTLRPQVPILKISDYSNAKSLACDTANEHALTCTRETCSCSQTVVQWNQWR